MVIAVGQVFWFASRASGLVLWLLRAAGVAWGLAISSRLVRRRGLPAWMLSLHKHLGTLAMVFLVVHLVAIWGDSYVEFGPRELFLPMASRWRPGAVTWGIAATYLLVIVQVSSWFMKRLPRRLWHAIHLLSLPVLVTGTAHGILSGADWNNRAVQWSLLAAGVAVVWVSTFRLLAPRRDQSRAEQLASLRRSPSDASLDAVAPGGPSALLAADPTPAAAAVWAPPTSTSEPLTFTVPIGSSAPDR